MTEENTNSMLDLNFDDVYEMETFGEGQEISVRIASAVITPKKTNPNETQLVVKLEDPSDEKKEDIMLYLPIPTEDERMREPKKANKKMLRIQDFYDCFDIDKSRPVDFRTVVGNTGFVVIGVQPPDGQYSERNFVRSFVLRK